MKTIIYGTLSVTIKHGSKGDFAVGTLHSSIGSFSIRDSWLETLDAGDYDGEFSVQSLNLRSYVWNGRSHTEIQAFVSDYKLNGFGEALDEEVFIEDDPIITETGNVISEEKFIDIDTAEVISSINYDEQDSVEQLRKLAGLHVNWQLGDGVKIDNTLDRATIRAIKILLESFDYQFEPKEQVWFKPVDSKSKKCPF